MPVVLLGGRGTFEDLGSSVVHEDGSLRNRRIRAHRVANEVEEVHHHKTTEEEDESIVEEEIRMQQEEEEFVPGTVPDMP